MKKSNWRELRKASKKLAKRNIENAPRFLAKITVPGHTDPRVPASTAKIERLMKEKGLPRNIIVEQVLRPRWDGHVRFPR
jgi:hypothetical protein